MFQLQCLRNIRIILWNEPNVEEANEDDLLKLLGGDTLKINVKNTNDNYVEYTPVIVTAKQYRDWETDRKSTRLNSSHRSLSRMPSSA